MISPKAKNILVKPVFMDFGRVGNNPLSMTATVTNEDDANTFTANAQGNGKDFVSFEPQSFELQKGETKEVKVNINNSDKLPVGPYDYSVTFSKKSNNNDFLSTTTSNSLRIKFIKEGIDVASIRVTDINKPAPANFYIIFANFKSGEETINSTVSILSKEDGKEVANFNENINMKPYPSDGYFGTMKFNWETKDAKMGDYIVKYKAVKADGTVLEGEKPFAVGELKGNLTSVEAKDTFKGETAKVSARISNVGSLNLPVIFNVVIKNDQGEEVFKDEKQVTIDPGNEETIDSEWLTTDAKVGEYTVEYNVKMGDEVVSNTLNFKVLSSYKFHIIIAGILIILLIMFIIIAKRKNVNREED
jgi:methionine-rich copper-binding protein CopC